MTLEELKPGVLVGGIVPNATVTVIAVQMHGQDACTLTYRNAEGNVAEELLYRHDEDRLTILESVRPWGFDGAGDKFRLVAEAHRIRLAHLFDPLLAVHTSSIEPLPHQITAVYQSMLPRQPLRFLLADDPGSGKTIMAGLLIKELIARADLKRCLIVCPGSLVEQWQDELHRRFHLSFEIATNDKIEAARTGNWFQENDLVIARLDKLARSEDVQRMLSASESRYDLIVVDEAHKMSATFFGGEIRYTRRYHLGRLLSGITRHFLLMTATPHKGKQEDFQLFLALLDGDRFEGRFRDGVHQADAGDLMRRMVKEQLLKFDGRPLFPERRAYTLNYSLSELEARLYNEVTEYVREEFGRAEALNDERRSGTVGFALTILQRRLASSPEAIYQSLRRRRERLEKRLEEIRSRQRREPVVFSQLTGDVFDIEELEDLEEAPENEIEEAENQIFDQATAAATINELKAEIDRLVHLEQLAAQVRRSGQDRKWSELSLLLDDVFTESDRPPQSLPEIWTASDSAPKRSPGQKIVIFTEHRDTLNYLKQKITDLFGRPEAVVQIHGGMGRDERRTAQDAFLQDPDVKILLATDAAGEGINLQRAHLMVNYDLPWNPNRLEQRFGRIHRIGQTEVCHMFNLVAGETREGDVYCRLLEKIEEARKALGGQVFDVLGQLEFDGRPLRDLLVEAILYGDRPEVRARLLETVEHGVDQEELRNLIEGHALAPETMDISRVLQVRQEMERAEARRLQPHYIEEFFLEAFKQLGGSIFQREHRRYEIKQVPAEIRNRAREIGARGRIPNRYERITFEKNKTLSPGQASAEFVCPGHPLLDAVTDLTLQRYQDLLKRGTILVDDRDPGTRVRVMFVLEHSIQDGSRLLDGNLRTISRRMLYVEMEEDGKTRHPHYAPYLDYRPLREGEPSIGDILARPECAWIKGDLERRAIAFAINTVVPEHLKEVRDLRHALVNKTREAVNDRLLREIAHWDRRAEELRFQEQAGRPAARLNSTEAARRAEELQARLQKRLEELDREQQISAKPPIVIGGLLVVPAGLIAQMTNRPSEAAAPANTLISAARARAAVMERERSLGFEPVDREEEKLGYDIESLNPLTGELRFIEVKGRITGADTITVTKNEILTSLNKPDKYILALVEFMNNGETRVRYVREPFRREPDFGVTSVNYNFNELLARSEEPN